MVSTEISLKNVSNQFANKIIGLWLSILKNMQSTNNISVVKVSSSGSYAI
jgi:hypothetical protein